MPFAERGRGRRNGLGKYMDAWLSQQETFCTTKEIRKEKGTRKAEPIAGKGGGPSHEGHGQHAAGLRESLPPSPQSVIVASSAAPPPPPPCLPRGSVWSTEVLAGDCCSSSSLLCLLVLGHHQTLSGPFIQGRVQGGLGFRV